MPMQGIVCIAGTNRPENYTVRALGIVVDAFRQSRVDPVVFDARTLSLAFPSVLAGKPVALVGVAAGRIGAIKALEQLKSVCAHIGAIVVPGAVSVAGVQQVFNDQGRCTDADVDT